ncbi:hypothetical protein SAMN05421820_102329 [Pedobacter steynii]|uniref:Uncharacterized protein n=1 Tax=Pedobacter steynii TaxID=430522 RepID=A0A1G9NHT1_9SPHI|nr:hypothetical protein [Pedobacter steynii]NQX39300.1 hypothetical protein [Pedobacter steynii]SDL85910.1 hypothetical protein SAMN05421820_102329 [Pedobacter steynii]
MKISKLKLPVVVSAAFLAINVMAQNPAKPLQISGVYPHLATFNEGWTLPGSKRKTNGDGGENGIGAITPWAGKLWMVTYSPHLPKGSSDKLYSVDDQLNVTIHPESIGGTPANRMIHNASGQLITSNYFIDKKGTVRTIPFSVMPGRMTATAAHLTDPANMVYFYDMEGMLYEANVHTLAVKKLFNKPVPGWHGKGAYTAQKQLVVANNGEDAVFKLKKEMLEAGDLPQNEEDKGVLASWDGKDWKIIARRQFTDVTGPGGIYGSPTDKSPLWSIGWDKRSVMLKLLDDGKWYTYRLPKAARTYDHRGGWYTEWPRIREVGNGKMLMDMHGMLYDFPKTFSRNNSAGITPVSSHLRYIPDFCSWNNQIVFATDETTVLENPMAGRAQSNLWFGQWSDLKNWGGATGWGGPWDKDEVKAAEVSDPFLVKGFDHKVLHLAQSSNHTVSFTIQLDKSGNNKWEDYKTIVVPANGYQYFIFPANFNANWVRFKTDAACTASAFFHFTGKMQEKQDAMFNSIAGINEKVAVNENLIRPAGHNKNLQVLNISNSKKQYSEIDEKLQVVSNIADSTKQMEALLALDKTYTVDDASVMIKDKTGTFRLPLNSGVYETFASRVKREIESERFMLNIQGTFYEAGRESGLVAIRPIATHKKKIVDFCTWRGLLVLSGTKLNAGADGHYFGTGTNGLWYGAIDDIWKMGKPVGEGGVWKNTDVKAKTASLPYLMTGYDHKTVSITADKDVNITLEINFDLTGFYTYKTFALKAGQTLNHVFPAGFSAHWVKAIADKDCKATVWFKYK